MNAPYDTRTTCRSCGAGPLVTVLDLGAMKVNAFPATRQEADALDTAPVCLARCPACGLVQLRDTVARDRLYRTYWYRSSTNEAMVAALKDVADDAMRRVPLKPGDCVLDIGANDGTLLGLFPTWTKRRGYEPSQIAVEALDTLRGDGRIAHDYFPPTIRAVNHEGIAKVVTSIAVFYDVDDLPAFVREVRTWLHPEGVWILQLQDLASMVNCNGVDNLCHEHLSYFDLPSLRHLLDRFDLAIADWSHNDVNGGSLRVVVQHRRAVAERVDVLPGVRPSSLERFALAAANERDNCRAFLRAARRDGKSVYGLAASTKFNTLSQFYGLGPDDVTAIAERQPQKWGRYTATGIPICSEDELRAARPDFALIGAWQFAEGIIRRERALLEAGTRFVVPLPAFRIVGREALAEAA